MEDLRVPIGSFFAILGILMLIAAALPAGGTAPLAPPHVDLYCGILNLLFGIIMLWLARRAA